ncbi:RNA-binding protein [Antarcticirhabdus aurantiaca]|uniref:RNA-binding protein n=1 Tax=Antarcticirhabdus aurantiaca TaxID=2606717 RepID=A0ACD4NQL3_9HYPH|nr:RNA-binding protein [Antarcticirhabdus aurantiaca]WAJ29043.1 RNA-binding protein [Jeongeuplla avenae]
MAEAVDIERDEEADGIVNERQCIVSRARLAPEAMIRFVRAPDGRVVPDLRRRLPGRGANVENRRAAVETAVKRRLFGRALKAEVRADETLADEVDRLLAQSALGSMGLARKAGQVVSGAAKVEAAVRSGKALVLVQASDGAPDGLRKMDGARRAAANGDADAAIPRFRLFESAEMSLAIGGVNVIHAAILAGSAGLACLKRLEALAIYRGDSPDDVDDGRGPTPAQETEA